LVGNKWSGLARHADRASIGPADGAGSTVPLAQLKHLLRGKLP